MEVIAVYGERNRTLILVCIGYEQHRDALISVVEDARAGMESQVVLKLMEMHHALDTRVLDSIFDKIKTLNSAARVSIHLSAKHQ